MYEITVIERHVKTNELVMAHIPCQDDDIDTVAADLIKQENIAVEGGLILSYTTITHYYPNRDAYAHYAPAKVLGVQL